jgi:hypothetical protein
VEGVADESANFGYADATACRVDIEDDDADDDDDNDDDAGTADDASASESGDVPTGDVAPPAWSASIGDVSDSGDKADELTLDADNGDVGVADAVDDVVERADEASILDTVIKPGVVGIATHAVTE